MRGRTSWLAVESEFPQKTLHTQQSFSRSILKETRLPIAAKSFLCFAKGTYWCTMHDSVLHDRFFLPIVEIVRSSGGRPAKNLGNQAGTWLVVCVEQNGPSQTVGAVWSLTWPLQDSWRLAVIFSLNISELYSYLNWLSYFTNVATGWLTVTSSEKEIVGTTGFPFQTKPFTQVSSLQSYMDLNQPGTTFSWQR